MTQLELAGHLERMLPCFEGVDPWDDAARASWEALVTAYPEVLAAGFNRARLQAGRPCLSQREALARYTGTLFDWLHDRHRFLRFVYLYWDDRGRAESTFTTAWHQVARWSVGDALRKGETDASPGLVLPPDLSLPAPIIPPGEGPDQEVADSSASPEARAVLRGLLAFLDAVRRKPKNGPRDATVFFLFHYHHLYPMDLVDAGVRAALDHAVAYCVAASGMDEATLRAEIAAAAQSQRDRARTLRKDRVLRDDPPIPYEAIGRWMGEKPDARGYFGNLQSRVFRLREQYKATARPGGATE